MFAFVEGGDPKWRPSVCLRGQNWTAIVPVAPGSCQLQLIRRTEAKERGAYQKSENVIDIRVSA